MIAAVGGSGLRGGEWRLLEAEGWPDNRSCDNLLTWSWSDGAAPKRHLVVINWSGDPSQGRIRPGWGDLAGRQCRLTDLLEGSTYERDGTELSGAGLFVDLGPWGFHLLEMH
jgi:hypothetical protein